MQTVRSTGRQLFGDNCAACHGRDGKGRANYPDLTDDDWLWGGGPELIEQTMRVGINTRIRKAGSPRCPPSDATRCSTAIKSGTSPPTSIR